ncbi:hypothetical protein MACH08_18950 [Oceanobacillus kimchii]|uniref:DUF2651 domain-containing protein n=1 Tax=Oceanobacillus kimchii TaxID=746691 RepID=A0ABQ5TGW6_9BACI|nr:hypothetical protein MACH08_18950 [Oceanobacillus kimchii]
MELITLSILLLTIIIIAILSKKKRFRFYYVLSYLFLGILALYIGIRFNNMYSVILYATAFISNLSGFILSLTIKEEYSAQKENPI